MTTSKLFFIAFPLHSFLSSAPLNHYLELKAVVPLQILSLGLVQTLRIHGVTSQWFQSQLIAVFKADFIIVQVQICDPRALGIPGMVCCLIAAHR